MITLISKLKVPIFNSLIISMGLLSFSTLANTTFTCPVNGIQKLKYKARQNLSIKEKFLLKKERTKLYYTISKQVFASFADDSLNSNELKLCLATIDDISFEHIASALFRSKFIDSIGSTKSPLLKMLLDDVFGPNNDPIIGFHLGLEEDPHKRIASYHRTGKSIQLSILKTTFNEAKLYLVHELVHKLDENALFKSSLNYSNISDQKKIWGLAQKYSLPHQLNYNEKALLDQYLLNGLNRGLLAEFKAWSLSYRIYQEMIDHQEINPISWAQKVLNKHPINQSYLDFIFSYYQPRFTKPGKNNDNLFYWDLVSNAYDDLIKDIERSDKCLLLNDLKHYFMECTDAQ